MSKFLIIRSIQICVCEGVQEVCCAVLIGSCVLCALCWLNPRVRACVFRVFNIVNNFYDLNMKMLMKGSSDREVQPYMYVYMHIYFRLQWCCNLEQNLCDLRLQTCVKIQTVLPLKNQTKSKQGTMFVFFSISPPPILQAFVCFSHQPSSSTATA